MKVICIDDKMLPDEADNGSILKEGDHYTVLQECIGYENADFTGKVYSVYELAEDRGFGYDKWRFIPLSEIDEKEFERNYNKQLA